MMNPCAKYEEWISAYIDGALNDDEQAECLAHIQSCPSCAAILKDYETMSAALRDMEQDPPETLTADLMENIQTRSTFTVRHSGMIRRYAALAAALAVVTFIGIYTFAGSPQPALGGGEPEAVVRAAPAQAPVDNGPIATPLPTNEAQEAEFYDSGHWGQNFCQSAAGEVIEIAAPPGVESSEPREPRPHPETGSPDAQILSHTLFDLFLTDEILWDWDELRAQLTEKGYRYEVEDHVFVIEDPYRPGSYLYGMLISDRSYPGNTIIRFIGYAYWTEDVYRRVELWAYDGEVSYYYGVSHRGETGTLTITWERLRTFLFSDRR